MDPRAASVLADMGGGGRDFRARTLDRATAEGADLVLTMTVEQRTAVLQQAPRVLRRAFTLLEAAWRLDLVSAQEVEELGVGGERVRRLAAALDRTRSLARTPGTELVIDVPDPIGQPVEVHREVGSLIAAAVLPLLVVLDPAGWSTHPLG